MLAASRFPQTSGRLLPGRSPSPSVLAAPHSYLHRLSTMRLLGVL